MREFLADFDEHRDLFSPSPHNENHAKTRFLHKKNCRLLAQRKKQQLRKNRVFFSGDSCELIAGVFHSLFQDCLIYRLA